ncbi:MAG: phospholipase [Methylibium sp. NZG]|nr:MAG: phospholipase [Methylibium sp. NZG]
MAKQPLSLAWASRFNRSFFALTRSHLRAGSRAMRQALKPAAHPHQPPAGRGDWIAGVAFGVAGARRFRLYRPPGVQAGDKLPLIVMLHGCGQDARSFAASTRMNRVAARERFLVLYPEQERLANSQGCWNWFDTRSGRADGEAALILNAIDQVCLLHPVDRACVALVGLSSGASMAALLATQHPQRFKALVMHSGVPPGTAHSTLSALRAMNGRGATRPPSAAESAGPAWPPLMVIHGAADAVVAASNGQAAVQLWADAAGARTAKARRAQRGKRYGATVTDFKRRSDVVATLVEVDGLGHAWSGGAASEPFSDSLGPDASRMAWAFAARQFAKA